MKLYEINAALESLLDNMWDHETGELIEGSEEQIDCLREDREKKVLDTACYIRGLEAEAEAIAAEAKKLQERKKTLENRGDWLRGYLSRELTQGETFKDSRISLSWRKSSYVNVIDEDLVPGSFKIITETVSKKMLSDAIKAGSTVPGAEICERMNLVVK